MVKEKAKEKAKAKEKENVPLRTAEIPRLPVMVVSNPA